MSKTEKLRQKVLLGYSDANIEFEDLCTFLRSMGFVERVKGSHHTFVRSGVEEILNIQPRNNKAKPYQVKQVRNVILKYKLGGHDE